MTDRPNYATLRHDDVLPYITDLSTGKRLYKHPPCRICGIATYSFSTEPQDCKEHLRLERNDNEAA